MLYLFMSLVVAAISETEEDGSRLAPERHLSLPTLNKYGILQLAKTGVCDAAAGGWKMRFLVANYPGHQSPGEAVR